MAVAKCNSTSTLILGTNRVQFISVWVNSETKLRNITRSYKLRAAQVQGFVSEKTIIPNVSLIPQCVAYRTFPCGCYLFIFLSLT